jgi:hypothetical protein
MAVIPTKVKMEEWWDAETIPLEELRPEPKRDILLIVGDGSSVLDDLSEFFDFAVPHDTLCLTHAAVLYHELLELPFEHYAVGDSHREYEQELAGRLPDSVLKHAWNPKSKNFDVRWIKGDNRGWSGTTLNLGIKVGLALDYLRLVLAGCPMDNSGHWYDRFLKKNDNKLKNDHRHHLWFWTEMATRPSGRFIRSMSGNTGDLLGVPTIEWLEGGINGA